MPYQNQVRPLNLFADFMSGKQARQDETVATQQNALRAQQLQRGQSLNALAQDPTATAEQYIRAGDAQTGAALQGVQDRQGADRSQALGQVSSIAQKALTIQDPGQRRSFIHQAVTMYGPAFQALGADTTKRIAELEQLPDDQLTQRLQQVAQFSAPEKPIEVAAGASLATRKPDGSYQATFTAPTAPVKRTVEWKDVGDRLMPVYSDTGADVPGLAPKPKGASPSATNSNQSQLFTKADKLRDEYNAQNKNYVTLGDSYRQMQASAQNPSAAGDIALIFQYMKMLDPTSVVREGEFATAQNAAGIPDRVRNAWNKAINGERLNPEQRTDFIAQANKIYNGEQQRNRQSKSRYTEIAKRWGINPNDVVGDLDVMNQGASTPGQQPKTVSFNDLPP